jgi:hypothetical protein
MTEREAVVSEKNNDEAFLSRWSRKKNESRVEEKAPPPTATEPVETPAPTKLPELPDVETLTAQSDFSLFMQEGVPDELRSKALKKLWASDPFFNTTDGLDLYTDDRSFLPPLPEEAVAALKKALWGTEPSPPAAIQEEVDESLSTVYTSESDTASTIEKPVQGEALADDGQSESGFGGGGAAEGRSLEPTCESAGQAADSGNPGNSSQT